MIKNQFIQRRLVAAKLLLKNKTQIKCFDDVCDLGVGDLLDDPTNMFTIKRTPSLRESIEATLSLFDLRDKFVSVVAGTHEGIFWGGSLAYAPFFAVRNDSDLDLLIISDDAAGVILRSKGLFRDLQFNPSGNEAEIITVKGDSIEGPNISYHIMSYEVAKRMLISDFRRDLISGHDVVFEVRDLKSSPFLHSHCRQRSFSGDEYQYLVISESHGIYIMPGYIIHNGILYPGIYHAVIFPEFKLLSSSERVVSLNVQFQEILMDRVEWECQTYHDIEIHLLKGHIRSEILLMVNGSLSGV